jgi:hypothetical protein
MKDSTKNSAPIAPASTEPKVGCCAKPNVAKPSAGTLVHKKNTASGGAGGTTGARSNKQATGGAAYGITAKIPAYKSPEAGATQGNGRLFQAAVKRTAPNFRDGISSQS